MCAGTAVSLWYVLAPVQGSMRLGSCRQPGPGDRRTHQRDRPQRRYQNCRALQPSNWQAAPPAAHAPQGMVALSKQDIWWQDCAETGHASAENLQLQQCCWRLFPYLTRCLKLSHTAQAPGKQCARTHHLCDLSSRGSEHSQPSIGRIMTSKGVPGMWSSTNPMGAARYDFAAVEISNSATLPSGRVIVAGGYAGANTLVPAGQASENLNVGGTNPFQWSFLTNFTPRAQLQMVVQNVQTALVILATGGLNAAGAPVRITQTFSYLQGLSWASTTDMPTARSQHQMVTLQDGRVLVAGVPSSPKPLPTPVQVWFGQHTVGDITVDVTHRCQLRLTLLYVDYRCAGGM